MLWKHKTLIVLLWAVIGVAGLLGVRFVPDIYRSESLILVDSQKIPERFVTSTVEVTLHDHLANLSQQILSSTQLEKVIEKFNLYPKQRKTMSPEQVISLLRDELEITPQKGWGGERSASKTGGAFRVAYEGRIPTVVAGVVNEISGLFIAENLRTRELRAEGTSDFIESQLEEARKSLEKQEANLSGFKRERIGELPEQEAALIGTLARLHSELQGNQDAANRAEQNRIMLENTMRLAEASEDLFRRTVEQAATPKPVSASVAKPDAQEDPAAASQPTLRSQVLKARLEALQIRYQDEHPEIKRMKSELEIVLKQEEAAALAAVEKPTTQSNTARKSPATEPQATAAVPLQLTSDWNRERERLATVKTQLAVVKKELESRVAERQRILRNIAEYQSKVERLPLREQELAAVTRDYEISKTNYKSLLDKKLSAGMATEMERRQQAERFTLQDPARIPSKPIRPRRMILNGGAILAGLLLGLALALAIEFRKNNFLGEWELPPTALVLGRVPMIVIEPSGESIRGEG